MTEEFNNPIAIVIDGVVAKVISFDDATYAAIKSNPTFVDIKGNADSVEVGHVYNSALKTFTAPDPTAPEDLNIVVQ
ncbi:MAG: hypothetical protein EBW76_07000 [Actinobacteria bacterium]|jgi:hypothetical protein|nr:hypothetical protein [Actinomycetota bacterium]NCW93013.1 hypothetical protein [Actinomycetota bacterium]